MKKYLLLISLLALFVVSNLCAFDKGTINPGGSISYTSSKYDSDSDTATNFSFSPQVGYFFMENIAGDLMINLSSGKQGDYKNSSFAIGIGGRYFYNQIYGGLGLMMLSSSSDNGSSTYKESSNYLNLKAGYLVPVVENVYVDLGLNYKMGMGEYGGDAPSGTKNKSTLLGFNVGFQIYFPFSK